MFSFLWLCRQQQCDFVVRAAQDRCVDLLVEQADAPLPPRSHHRPRAEPPEGVQALEWILLTSVPTMTVEQAWQRVDWYRARWIVEDYHQGLKTGCSIELRQLQSYEALRRLLGLLAPTAVRLLQLRAVA